MKCLIRLLQTGICNAQFPQFHLCPQSSRLSPRLLCTCEERGRQWAYWKRERRWASGEGCKQKISAKSWLRSYNKTRRFSPPALGRCRLSWRDSCAFNPCKNAGIQQVILPVKVSLRSRTSTCQAAQLSTTQEPRWNPPPVTWQCVGQRKRGSGGSSDSGARRLFLSQASAPSPSTWQQVREAAHGALQLGSGRRMLLHVLLVAEAQVPQPRYRPLHHSSHGCPGGETRAPPNAAAHDPSPSPATRFRARADTRSLTRFRACARRSPRSDVSENRANRAPSE